MAVTSCSFLILLFIFTTISFHCTSFASSQNSLEAASNPFTNSNLESKADKGVPLWCVGQNKAEDSALQGALDWACGQGGADCSPVQQGGPCYDPSNVLNMASYAFNDYYLKHGMTQESCNFGNTAALTSLNPSRGKCVFPSSSVVLNIGLTGSQTAEVEPNGEVMSGGVAFGGWGQALITLVLALAYLVMF